MPDLPFWPAAALWWLSIGVTAAVIEWASDASRARDFRVDRALSWRELLVIGALGPLWVIGYGAFAAWARWRDGGEPDA